MQQLPELVLNILAQFVNNREILPRKSYTDKDFGNPLAMFDYLTRSVQTPQTARLSEGGHSEYWRLIQEGLDGKDSTYLFEYLSEVLYISGLSEEQKENAYSSILDAISLNGSYYEGHLFFQDYKPTKLTCTPEIVSEVLNNYGALFSSEANTFKDAMEELWNNYGTGLTELLDAQLKPGESTPTDPLKWFPWTCVLLTRVQNKEEVIEQKEEEMPQQATKHNPELGFLIHPVEHYLANQEKDEFYRGQLLEIMKLSPIKILEKGIFDAGIIRKITCAGSPALQYQILSNEFHHKFGRYADKPKVNEQRYSNIPTFDCGPTLELLAAKGLSPALGYGDRHYDEPMITDSDVLKSLLHFPALFDLAKCSWAAAANTKIFTVDDFVEMYRGMTDKEIAKCMITKASNLCARFNTPLTKFNDLEEYRLFVASKLKEAAQATHVPLTVVRLIKQETPEQRETKMKEQNKLAVFRSFLRFMQNDLTDDHVSDQITGLEILEGLFTPDEFWEYMDKYAPVGLRYGVMGTGKDQDLVFHLEALFSANRMYTTYRNELDQNSEPEIKGINLESSESVPKCQCPRCKEDTEAQMAELVSEALEDDLIERIKNGEFRHDKKAEQQAEELMSSFAEELTGLAMSLFGVDKPRTRTLGVIMKDLQKTWKDFEKQRLDKAFNELVEKVIAKPIEIKLDETSDVPSEVTRQLEEIKIAQSDRNKPQRPLLDKETIMTKRRDLRKGSFLDITLPLPVCNCPRCKAEGRGSEEMINAVREIGKMMEEMFQPSKDLNPGMLKANDPDFRNAIYGAMSNKAREHLNRLNGYTLDFFMEPGIQSNKFQNPMRILKGRELDLGDKGRGERFFMFDPTSAPDRMKTVMKAFTNNRLSELADKIIAGEVDYQHSLRELQGISETSLIDIGIKDLLRVIAKKQGTLDVEQVAFDKMSTSDFGSILKYKINLIRHMKGVEKVELAKKKLAGLREELVEEIKKAIWRAQKVFMETETFRIADTIILDNGNFVGNILTHIDSSDMIPQIVSTFALVRSKNGPVGIKTEWSTNDFINDPFVTEAVMNHIFKDQK